MSDLNILNTIGQTNINSLKNLTIRQLPTSSSAEYILLVKPNPTQGAHTGMISFVKSSYSEAVMCTFSFARRNTGDAGLTSNTLVTAHRVTRGGVVYFALRKPFSTMNYGVALLSLQEIEGVFEVVGADQLTDITAL